LIYLLFFSLCAFSGDLSPPLHLHGTFHVIWQRISASSWILNLVEISWIVTETILEDR
jgi:hypothetical protein